ncbi:MAG: bifunctional hydroxymethylpyrimidine kinase/phosphomethylpyrimidine kinase [Alphaproteobacteria bacterium]|nr:bifunctional hydroxymethylpyrimidine kinase/phosphomethylpyrimidine kinase [Alphaproteobacteria bacterium]
MPLVLVLSSHVASSLVGSRPVAHALAARKIDTVIAPTTLLGRHPGWGPPGGGGVPRELFQGMLDGVEANGLFSLTDAVLTGYFATVAQIEAAAGAIARVRAAQPSAWIVVDPIMGDDDEGLYVKPEVADAVMTQLAPQADLLAPNLWELGHLTQGRFATAPTEIPDIIAAARSLGRPVLVSSVRLEGEIGALYVDANGAWGAMTQPAPRAPNGTGDLLIGSFMAARISGAPPHEALAYGVAVTADVVRKADKWEAPELPIVAARESFDLPFADVRLFAVE